MASVAATGGLISAGLGLQGPGELSGLRLLECVVVAGDYLWLITGTTGAVTLSSVSPSNPVRTLQKHPEPYNPHGDRAVSPGLLLVDARGIEPLSEPLSISGHTAILVHRAREA